MLLLQPHKVTSPLATVRVIDDEDVVLMTVTKMLGRLGHAVIAARSCQDAVQIFHRQQNKIDMIIMEMAMPDIRPDQLPGTLREFHSDAKVILSSGYSLANIESGNLHKGSNGFLQKPYQLAELSKIVHATLET